MSTEVSPCTYIDLRQFVEHLVETLIGVLFQASGQRLQIGVLQSASSAGVWWQHAAIISNTYFFFKHSRTQNIFTIIQEKELQADKKKTNAIHGEGTSIEQRR